MDLKDILAIGTLIIILIWGQHQLKEKVFQYPLVAPLENYVIQQDNTLKGTVNPVDFKPRTLGTRITTAYNAVEEQCDDTPCISASGLNICETVKTICATNELPFGTILHLKEVSTGHEIICEVQDRTNARYTFRIDVLMEDYDEAIHFGKKTMLVEIIN